MNNKAWSLLSEDERTALTLSISYNKSSWQSGEIMGKSHYKYLEIRQRAERLMKLFDEYLSVCPKVIPEVTSCSKEFGEYIKLAFTKRLVVKEIVQQMDYEPYKDSANRKRMIINEVEGLKRSKHFADNAFYQVIMEFDRWNNHRILPVEIQEPSAYKRRNKHRSRKLVKLACSLSDIAAGELIKRYEIKKAVPTVVYYFVPVIPRSDFSKAKVVRFNSKNLDEVTHLGLFVFRTHEEAMDFMKALIEYMAKEFKHCKDGQKFWPKFRLLSRKAINYEILQNINADRKLLEMAGMSRVDKPLSISLE